MAVNMKIKPTRGTKSRIETVKNELVDYQIVYATDTKELGVKNTDGTVSYMANETSLDGLATKEELNGKLDIEQADGRYASKSVETTKQEELVSGVNIKTVGMQSLLGSGNISIPSTEEFASKQELSAYISSKNEPNIDLKGKTHLGGGVYLLTTQNGMDLTFNARNGEFRLFGIATGQLTYSLGTRPVGDYYMQIWKTTQVAFSNGAILYGGGGGEMQVAIWPKASYEGRKPLYTTQYTIGTWNVSGPIDVYFKVQLEKGTTPTPYAVPSGVIPYLPEVKSELDDKLNWTLIATNSSEGRTDIAIPNGAKELLITTSGTQHSTVNLPNVLGASGVSIKATTNTVQVGATWNIGHGGIVKVSPDMTTYRIYGR